MGVGKEASPCFCWVLDWPLGIQWSQNKNDPAVDLSRDQKMPLACLKFSRGEEGSTLKCHRSDVPTPNQEAKWRGWSKLLCSSWL